MNFHFPERRPCAWPRTPPQPPQPADPAGALVRDARIWSRYLNEAIDLFADDTDVASPPTLADVGPGAGGALLSLQRDLYAYLHDQTLRLLNQGHTGIEIAR